MKKVISRYAMSCLILIFACSNQIMPMVRAAVSRPSERQAASAHVLAVRSLQAHVPSRQFRDANWYQSTPNLAAGITPGIAQGFSSGDERCDCIRKTRINNALAVIKKHRGVLQLHVPITAIDSKDKIDAELLDAFDCLHNSGIPVQSESISAQSVKKRNQERDKQAQELADDSCAIL